ncbi:aldehyde dehydrogenase family protein [Microbacterium gorillae]|uniref:aldehyde dehydrogenase family protein n=1 Tax=Microbacterium gorillae TaxID=1231063 RepID=UPI00058F3C49|nr:aldehyde dehydrogenase family protein [Microbacterium gorillae]
MPELTITDDAVSLIDGEPVVARGQRIPVRSAYTQQTLGHVVEADDTVVDRAVNAARTAFVDWSARSIEERAELVRRAADVIEEQGATIAELVTAEMGMPISLSRATQWKLPASVLRTAAERVTDVPWNEPITGATLHRRPSGVVAAISPWNMPTYQTVAKVAAALVAGCTVVIKPSVQTPFDAAEFVRLLHAAGIPEGVVQLVQGSGSVTGAALSRHPGVNHVSFTGSVDAGKSVAGLAATTLARCTLELGGKSPAVVLPSADLERVIPAILASGFVNAGQACNATTRLVVPANKVGEIEELVRASIGSFVIGDPFDEATLIGPLASVAHGEGVTGFIERALTDGGRLVTGGPERLDGYGAGYFLAPTVIADLHRSAEAVQEEIFGPALVIQPYDGIDDAVAVANDTRFGLSAEVWGPQDLALTVAQCVRAGQVKVNGVRTRERPGVPFGGVGESGYGRELGALGIEEFTDLSAVMS